MDGKGLEMASRQAETPEWRHVAFAILTAVLGQVPLDAHAQDRLGQAAERVLTLCDANPRNCDGTVSKFFDSIRPILTLPSSPQLKGTAVDPKAPLSTTCNAVDRAIKTERENVMTVWQYLRARKQQWPQPLKDFILERAKKSLIEDDAKQNAKKPGFVKNTEDQIADEAALNHVTKKIQDGPTDWTKLLIAACSDKTLGSWGEWALRNTYSEGLSKLQEAKNNSLSLAAHIETVIRNGRASNDPNERAAARNAGQAAITILRTVFKE